MTTLPFVTAPKAQVRTRVVGDESSGTLEFPVFGKVRLNERLHIKPEVFGRALLQHASDLGNAIRAAGASEEEAGRMALRILTASTGGKVKLNPAEVKAIEANTDLLLAAMQELNDLWRDQRTRTVTAMIRFRLPGCSEWSDEVTVTQLPDELQQAILRFHDEEEGAGTEKADDQEQIELLVEQLGKYERVMSPSPSPTGESATGDSAGSGPSTQLPIPSGSQTSAPARSSRQSPKARTR